MGHLTIIDTDILIDASRGVSKAIDCLKKHEKSTSLAISVITELELIVGCRNKNELRHLEKFLKRFQVLKLNSAISDKAIELLSKYRLSHGLLIPDGLIAATAIVWDERFVSKNQKDYRFIPELKLIPYL